MRMSEAEIAQVCEFAVVFEATGAALDVFVVVIVVFGMFVYVVAAGRN